MINIFKNNSKLNAALKQVFFSLISVLIAMIIAVFFIMWSKGSNFFESMELLFKAFWKGSFGNVRSFSETIVYTTIYLFTGLAHLIAFKTNLFNIGVEGQFLIGMLAAVIVGIIPGIPFIIHIFLILFVGIAAGAFWAFIPAFLKVKLNSNEVVNTIMMNFIALNIVNLSINTFLKDPNYQSSYTIQESAIIPNLFSYPGTRASYGIFIGIVCVVLMYIFINKTRIGYELRSVGYNKYASEYGGINIKKSVIISMIISGAIAGLGGAVMLSGVTHKIPRLQGLLNYGFDGIAVTLIANNNPIGIIFSSFLFGALNASSLELQFNGVPKDIVFIIQSIIILFIAGKYVFKYISIHVRKRGALK